MTHPKNKNKYFIKSNYDQGYAILFAVVIISIISILTIGLSNTTYKELILTSVTRDSSTSFFEADTATECALYADNVLNVTTGGSFDCGVDNAGHDLTFTTADDGQYTQNEHDGYKATSNLASTSAPCFDFHVDRLNVTQAGDPGTKIIGEGYSSCDLANPRTVERELDVTY